MSAGLGGTLPSSRAHSQRRLHLMTDSPHSHGSLLEALEQVEQEVGRFFGALAPDELVARPGAAWSPAEHLEHLVLAVHAVAVGLRMPRWLLRLRFGPARHASRSFLELRDEYRARLAAGARASGRYVPRRDEREDDASVRQTRLLADWYKANARLRDALDRWSERDLDRIRLPHPILGKLTARELVLFTIDHGQHHITAAARRLPHPGTSA